MLTFLIAASLVVGPVVEDTAGAVPQTPPTTPNGVASPAPSQAPLSLTPGPSVVPERRSTWAAPVSPVVVRQFDAPPQKWLPGHRGVDLRAPAGTVVTAPTSGTVAFVGTIAGRGVLSVDHPDPDRPGEVVRTTYEPVSAVVPRDAHVEAGQVLARVSDDSHCSGGCLHWGARRNDVYVDPMSLLGGRIRLWPPQAAGHG